MSNKFKGEVQLENGMIMRMDFNVIVEFEDMTGINAFTDEEKMNNLSLSNMRKFYYVALKANQPDITIEEAGDLFMEYPEALAEVFKAASPEDKGASKAPAKKNDIDGQEVDSKKHIVEILLETFLFMGYTEELFWSITPKQFFQYHDAFIKRKKMQDEDGLTFAWVSGRVAASFQTNDPIQLDDLLKGASKVEQNEDEDEFIDAQLINYLNRDSRGKPAMTLEEWKVALGIDTQVEESNF